MSRSLAFPTFEAYASQMNRVVVGLAHRYSRNQPHPFTEVDDLLQEGMLALWQVWSRHKKKPPEDLCKIGSRAVVNRLNETWTRARSRGQVSTSVISLDDVLPPGGEPSPQLAEFLGVDEINELLFRFSVQEIETMLAAGSYPTRGDRKVFREILFPSIKTLSFIRALIKSRKKRKPRPHSMKASVAAIAQTLDRKEENVAISWARIQRVTRSWLDGVVNPLVMDKEDSPMFSETTQPLPDADALGLAPVQPAKAPAKPKPAAKEKVTPPPAATKEETTPVKKKPAAAKKPPAKKAPAKKAAPAKKPAAKKPAAKAPAKKKDAVEKVTKGQALKVGTAVKYLGGSRTKNLKVGTEGKVTKVYPNESNSVRYGLRFPGRSTIMAANFVAKV